MSTLMDQDTTSDYFTYDPVVVEHGEPLYWDNELRGFEHLHIWIRQRIFPSPITPEVVIV